MKRQSMRKTGLARMLKSGWTALLVALISPPLLASIAAQSPTRGDSDLAFMAYSMGKMLGGAIYCNEASAERYGNLASDWLMARAASPDERADTLEIFLRAADVFVQRPPQAQSCDSFHARYEKRLQRLRSVRVS